MVVKQRNPKLEQTSQSSSHEKKSKAISKSELAFYWYITAVIDYLFAAAYFSALYWLWAGYDFKGDWKACFLLFWCIQTQGDLLIFRDNLFIWLFPSTIISRKKSEPGHTTTANMFPYIVKIRINSFGALSLLAYLGLAEFSPIPLPSFPSSMFNISLWTFLLKSTLPSLLYFQFESFVSGAIRDLLGMNLFHRWTHSSVDAYKYHKVHHTYTTGISVLRMVYFDVLDIMIENATGLTFLLAFKYFVFGQPLHVFTILLDFWFNSIVHSVNPLTCCFLNPVLDLVLGFMPALAHNVHHAVPSRNYMAIPWHQLTRSGMNQDIQLFNKYLDTRLPTLN